MLDEAALLLLCRNSVACEHLPLQNPGLAGLISPRWERHDHKFKFGPDNEGRGAAIADGRRASPLTRDEKLNALADVLITAAAKAKELSDTGKNGGLSRETALAMQIEGIAREFKALAAERAAITRG